MRHLPRSRQVAPNMWRAVYDITHPTQNSKVCYFITTYASSEDGVQVYNVHPFALNDTNE